MKEIPLTRGLYAIVDDDKFDFLNQFKWHALKARDTFYPARHAGIVYEYMHHLIIGFPVTGFVTDHMNRNGLDEQLLNLRQITHRQNLSRKLGRSSEYPGVSFNTTTMRWISSVYINGKSMILGSSSNEFTCFAMYRESIMSIGEELLPEHEEIFRMICPTGEYDYTDNDVNYAEKRQRKEKELLKIQEKVKQRAVQYARMEGVK
jgi:hypothetical protein